LHVAQDAPRYLEQRHWLICSSGTAEDEYHNFKWGHVQVTRFKSQRSNKEFHEVVNTPHSSSEQRTVDDYCRSVTQL